MSKIKKLIFLILFFVGIILLNTHVQASGDLYLNTMMSFPASNAFLKANLGP